jgi:ketosteroid isomerase-like protein
MTYATDYWEDGARAEHDALDLTRLERMERRLQALEDAEAIRNLKSRYAALCDDNYDADGIAALFAEDATWESLGLGRFEGRDAIRAFFRGEVTAHTGQLR